MAKYLGVYYWVVIKHSRPIRTWLLEPYFQALKRTQGESGSYVPISVSRPGEDTALLDVQTLFSGAAERLVWLRGEAGSGKSAAIAEAVRRFCEPGGLKEAFKRSGFIIIPVSLRDLRQASVPELATKAMAAIGVGIADTGFLDLLLKTGDVLLVLDGLNEMDVEAEVGEYATVAPHLRMVATSQTAAPYEHFAQFAIVQMTRQHAHELFVARAGESAHSLAAGVPPHVWGLRSSAYDVELLVSLVKAGAPMPAERTDLYDAALDVANAKAGGGIDLVGLEKLTWEMYLLGRRRLSDGDGATKQDLGVLERCDVVVPRGSAEWEFRHDLMRAYLAAKHVSRTNVAVTLTDERIWRLNEADQIVLFEFLAKLLSETQLETAFSVASKDPATRLLLLERLNRVATAGGWEWGRIRASRAGGSTAVPPEGS